MSFSVSSSSSLFAALPEKFAALPEAAVSRVRRVEAGAGPPVHPLMPPRLHLVCLRALLRGQHRVVNPGFELFLFDEKLRDGRSLPRCDLLDLAFVDVALSRGCIHLFAFGGKLPHQPQDRRLLSSPHRLNLPFLRMVQVEFVRDMAHWPKVPMVVGETSLPATGIRGAGNCQTRSNHQHRHARPNQNSLHLYFSFLPQLDSSTGLPRVR